MRPGHEIFDRIQADTIGNIFMRRDEAALFYDAIYPGSFYVEIGCLWGGSAILAAHRAKQVITVDPMEGEYWEIGFPELHLPIPKLEDVLENFAMFDVAHKINIVKKPSYPWPLSEEIVPDVMYIDGSHEYDAVLQDWKTASEITRRIILMHDYSTDHPGAKEVIDTEVKQDQRWTMVDKVESMIVLKKYVL